MMKVLCIHFSQSGQLTEIVHNFSSELKNVEIEYITYNVENAFPFPWTTPVFFNCMPECVIENEVPITKINYQEQKYDLIILGYQPWFLSPSLPTTSLLKDENFKKIVKDTPIVTVIGSRNMWLNSQESVKKMIANAGGILVGNVALADKVANLVSVLTIFHWMLTGTKTKKWGFLPKPGVSDEDIANVTVYGKLLNECIQQNSLGSYQEKVISNGGSPVPTNILFIEGKAKKIFLVWAKLIQKKAQNGKRSFWVNAFKYYLLFVLFVVSPILLFFYFILIWPFTQTQLKRKKHYFQGVKLR